MLRRQFLLHSTRIPLFGALVLLAQACSGEDTGSEPSGGNNPSGGGESECLGSAISANHGHELIVPLEDVEAGVDASYSIRGSSAHDHQVSLTPQDFAALAAGEDVVVQSTEGGTHSHTVTVRCA